MATLHPGSSLQSREHSRGALCSQPHPCFQDSPAGLPPVPPAKGKESGLRPESQFHHELRGCPQPCATAPSSVFSLAATPAQQSLIPHLFFHLQMEDLGVAPAVHPTQGTMPTFTSAFQRRAVGVLVASRLQRLLELVYRVLRHLAEP